MSERPEVTEQVAPGRGAEREFLVENDDALAALVNLIAVIGDHVYFLGRRVSEWADAGPLLESTAACAALLGQLPRRSVAELGERRRGARARGPSGERRARVGRKLPVRGARS